MKKRCFDKKVDAPPVLPQLSELYIMALCLLLPLLPSIGGYQNIGERAYLFFYVLSICYLAACAVVCLELVLVGKCSIRQLLSPLLMWTPAKLFLSLFLIWSLLSTLHSPFGAGWVNLGKQEGMLAILLYGLLFFVISAYGRWRPCYLYLLGVVTVLNALLGLLQYIGLNPLYLYPAGTNFHDAFIRYNGAFLGTLGNVDLLGAFLCLVVPLFYSTYLLTGIKKALIPFGTGAYLMMLADVDSGYLGLAAALILTVPLFFRRPTAWARGCIAFGVLSGAIGVAKLFYADHNRLFSLILSPQSIGWITFGLLLIVIGCFLGRRHWGGCCSVKALAVAILLLLCTALISVYAIPFSGGTAYELHQILHGNWDPSFGSGRIRIWQETLKLISETPFFGGGPGTLGERMPFTFTRYAAELGITIETIADTAHNDFLNIAVNEGIPALGFYLAMLACWIWRCCRHLDRKPVSLLLPCILAYLVQSCFTYSYCTAAALFWVFLALCEQTINTQKEELEK